MSNTMLALARLGAASKQRFGSGRMRAAFAAIAGSDPLGRFFLAQLQQAGLALLSNPTPDSNTGGPSCHTCCCHTLENPYQSKNLNDISAAGCCCFTVKNLYEYKTLNDISPA